MVDCAKSTVLVYNGKCAKFSYHITILNPHALFLYTWYRMKTALIFSSESKQILRDYRILSSVVFERDVADSCE
jgi:hypothetical protein